MITFCLTSSHHSSAECLLPAGSSSSLSKPIRALEVRVVPHHHRLSSWPTDLLPSMWEECQRVHWFVCSLRACLVIKHVCAQLRETDLRLRGELRIWILTNITAGPEAATENILKSDNTWINIYSITANMKQLSWHLWLVSCLLLQSGSFSPKPHKKKGILFSI